MLGNTIEPHEKNDEEENEEEERNKSALNDDKLTIIEICLLNYVANKMFA